MNKLNRKHYRKLPFSVNVSLKDMCFRGLFKHQLTSVKRKSELNLKLTFETQSFKPKRKKVIRAVETAGKGP